MKKYVYKIAGALSAGILLCGCGSEVPDLSEEQTALITEYATNLIVKHSKLSDRELLSDTQLEAGIIEEAEDRERQLKADEIAEAYLNKDVKMMEGAEADDDDSSSSSSGSSEAVPSLTIAEFFAEDDFSIEYASYELCDSYPEADGEDFFMAMDATAGHKLCVVKFQVQNVSSSEQELDMLSKKGRFTLRTQDGKTIQAQSTMLLNDLSSYKGAIAPSEGEEMVLVFEVEDSASQMDSMELIMKDESGENVISLN